MSRFLWFSVYTINITATKAIEFGETVQNNGHYTVVGHSRSPFLCPQTIIDGVT